MFKILLTNTACIALAILACGSAYSQVDTTKLNVYENLSLKDLLSVKIVSVSKQSELLFDAPLSASVLSKDEIRRAGCTSIMEALRLMPGMIVREQSNGNYDIYLRGMDNMPPNGAFEGNSTTTLVMINGRPIYNYLKGGTFWETLPVDINDVERIEVIRGPAAALYGPNAVSGVINIITRKIEKQGLYLVANSQQGSYRTSINNASLGYRFNKQWSLGVSGNYQGRNRTQTSYYETFRNEWLTDPHYLIGFLNDTVKNVKQPYPNPSLSMKKYAGNAFLNYRISDDIKVDIVTGMQHSMVQKVSTENGITPLTTVSSDSRYADLTTKIKDFYAQLSYNAGTQISDHQPGNKYDLKTFDANAEYNYTISNLSVKPGLNYHSAIYDDTKYSDTASRTGIFNTRGRITTISASLRGEYKLLNNRLRLVAGLMASKFNYPDTTYLSYNLAATYKIHPKHMVRVVYSSAPRSSTIYDTYVNRGFTFFPIGNKKFMSLQQEPNKSIKLLTTDMIEIGYRGSLTPAMHIDIELFNIRSKNYSDIIINRGYNYLRGTDTIVVVPFRATNTPITLLQQGITVTLTYSTKKIQVKPFVTIQKSQIRNYSPYPNTPDAAPNPTLAYNPALFNIYSGLGTQMSGKSTPSVFGGAAFTYMPSPKWNFNLSAYYYSSQVYSHVSNLIFNDGRGIDHIPRKTNFKCQRILRAYERFAYFLYRKKYIE